MRTFALATLSASLLAGCSDREENPWGVGLPGISDGQTDDDPGDDTTGEGEGDPLAPDLGGDGDPGDPPPDDPPPDDPPSGACKLSPHQTGLSSNALMKSKYELYVPPSYDPNVPMPVVIALHGTTQDGPYYLSSCGVKQAADARGFIALAPTGWQSGNQFLYDCCDANCLDICQADGEEDFMWEMLDEVSDCYNVDLSRLYMFGFSQGGFFSTFFCLTNETQVTACGAHGAGCYSGGNGGHCDLVSMGDESRKVPFWVYAGTADAYHEGGSDLAALLAKHGYPHEFTEPAGVGHYCDPSAVLPQWDWWSAQGAL